MLGFSGLLAGEGRKCHLHSRLVKLNPDQYPAKSFLILKSSEYLPPFDLLQKMKLDMAFW